MKVYSAGGLGKENQLLGFQELTTGYGYASGQPAVCHFGLGTVEKVDLEVTLPNGKIIRREGVTKINQLITIEE